MNAGQYLDLVEQTIQDPITRRTCPDRRILLNWLSRELQILSGREQWEFFQVRVAPLISTSTGKRNYPLPANFGSNFVLRRQGKDERYLCKLNNGTNESWLNYKSAADFYARDMESEDNGIPMDYTLTVTRGGRRELVLGPPPDANGTTGYTVGGVYVPTDWDLDEEDEVPPLPANSEYLEHRLLARIYKGRNADAFTLYSGLAASDLQQIYMESSRNRQVQMYAEMDWAR